MRNAINYYMNKLTYTNARLWVDSTLSVHLRDMKKNEIERQRHIEHWNKRMSEPEPRSSIVHWPRVDEANSHCLVQYQVQSSDISNGRYHQFFQLGPLYDSHRLPHCFLSLSELRNISGGYCLLLFRFETITQCVCLFVSSKTECEQRFRIIR